MVIAKESTTMCLSQILGWIATLLFSAMVIPQIYKTLKTQSVKDVSLPMFITGLIANCIVLWYALLINQNPLIIKYIIGIVVTAIYIGVYFKIRGNK